MGEYKPLPGIFLYLDFKTKDTITSELRELSLFLSVRLNCTHLFCMQILLSVSIVNLVGKGC